jgi:uncharacterized membrane protein YhhN
MIIIILITKPDSIFNKLIFTGFIFSLIGDIFLLQIIDAFVLGLLSFLLAHIFYGIAFIKRVNKLQLTASIPFYLIAFILSYILYTHLGEMLIPVLIYIFVIMTMVWRAYMQRKWEKSAFFAFLGAILFAVSDSNIAITKFMFDYPFSGIITMVLYWSAQYFIYKSTTKA